MMKIKLASYKITHHCCYTAYYKQKEFVYKTIKGNPLPAGIYDSANEFIVGKFINHKLIITDPEDDSCMSFPNLKYQILVNWFDQFTTSKHLYL